MKICVSCNKNFKPSSNHKKCPSCRRQAQKIPCSLCKKPMQYTSKTCSNCFISVGLRVKGEDNPRWKGGKIVRPNGYVYLYQPEHPRLSNTKNRYVFEHIIVMEQQLGRYLVPGETVHHINGVKDDNRPENLELWISNQPAGQRVCDLVSWATEIIERYGNECD